MSERRHDRDHQDHSYHSEYRGPAVSPGKRTITAGLVMRKAERDSNGVAAGADAAVDRAAGSSSSPLPEDLRGRFESSLGTDLSSVRVHTGSESAEASRAVGAKAYTTGQDIHFGTGHYDVSSAFGVHLLAHEVAHTVQQQGSAPTRQNKLEVSSPQDGAEHEADRAADAMVAGETAMVSTSTGVSRQVIQREPTTPHYWGEQTMDYTAGDDDRVTGSGSSMAGAMDRAANANEADARGMGKMYVETPIAGEMRLESLSSIETCAQARGCIGKVVSANAHLYQRRAAQQAKVKGLTSRSEMEEQDKAAAEVAVTDGNLGENEKVIASLQNIVDLGEGNSLNDESGNRPGHDMRLGVFSKLAETAFTDFARLQGVVNTFCDAHPMNDQAGDQGGVALGTAVATGGKSSDQGALAGVRKQIADAGNADAALGGLMRDFRDLYSKLADGGVDTKINAQMEKCASAMSKAKNIEANIDLGVLRPDTPAQAKAKAEADQVQQELSSAKAVLSQAFEIAQLAVSVMGMPAIGVLGDAAAAEGAAFSAVAAAGSKKNLMPTVKADSSPGTMGKVTGVARTVDSGQAKITGSSIEGQVSSDITTAIAKMMTDYDAKFTRAQASADQANKNAGRTVVTLNDSQKSVAKGDITAAFQGLARVCAEIEKEKAALRAKSMEIAKYQDEKRRKTGQQGPDVAGITKALAECAAYTVQAKAAITQGEEEQTIAREMSAERAKVAGEMSLTTDQHRAPDMGGNYELASSTSEYAYVDCEPASPFTRFRSPLSFQIKSEVMNRGEADASDDKARQNVEVANMGVASALTELKENIGTANGFEAALKVALGLS